MIEEVRVDSYGEYEELVGMRATLEDRVEFPFEA
jgi:Calcium binding